MAEVWVTGKFLEYGVTPGTTLLGFSSAVCLFTYGFKVYIGVSGYLLSEYFMVY